MTTDHISRCVCCPDFLFSLVIFRWELLSAYPLKNLLILGRLPQLKSITSKLIWLQKGKRSLLRLVASSAALFQDVILDSVYYDNNRFLWVCEQIIANNSDEQQRSFGRHFDMEDELVSRISRRSIDILKQNYRVSPILHPCFSCVPRKSVPVTDFPILLLKCRRICLLKTGNLL